MTRRTSGLMAAARRRKRWTQFELAKRVGCSESQIAKIETGRAVPESWLKEAIAAELGIATWEVTIGEVASTGSCVRPTERSSGEGG